MPDSGSILPEIFFLLLKIQKTTKVTAVENLLELMELVLFGGKGRSGRDGGYWPSSIVTLPGLSLA